MNNDKYSLLQSIRLPFQTHIHSLKAFSAIDTIPKQHSKFYHQLKSSFPYFRSIKKDNNSFVRLFAYSVLQIGLSKNSKLPIKFINYNTQSKYRKLSSLIYQLIDKAKYIDNIPQMLKQSFNDPTNLLDQMICQYSKTIFNKSTERIKQFISFFKSCGTQVNFYTPENFYQQPKNSSLSVLFWRGSYAVLYKRNQIVKTSIIPYAFYGSSLIQTVQIKQKRVLKSIQSKQVSLVENRPLNNIKKKHKIPNIETKLSRHLKIKESKFANTSQVLAQDSLIKQQISNDLSNVPFAQSRKIQKQIRQSDVGLQIQFIKDDHSRNSCIVCISQAQKSGRKPSPICSYSGKRNNENDSIRSILFNKPRIKSSEKNYSNKQIYIEDRQIQVQIQNKKLQTIYMKSRQQKRIKRQTNIQKHKPTVRFNNIQHLRC